MKAIFLADAHLRHPEDKNYQQLLNFLDQQQELDALFLLGDIFEFWLGYQHVTFSAYIPLLEKLRQLTEQGTKLFFVEGNHDFHLGPYFSDQLNCTIIPDQQQLEWDGKQLFLCHGDLLNPSRWYHRLRSLWRCRPIKLLTRIVHPDLVWSFGIWLSDLGKNKHKQTRKWDPSPLIIPVAEKLFATGCDVFFCGHFHQPTELSLAGKQIIAIGDWIEQYSYAEMLDGQISLKSYQP